MEFSQELIETDSIVTTSNIRYYDPLDSNVGNDSNDDNNNKNNQLDIATIHASNHAAGEFFLGKLYNKIYGFDINNNNNKSKIKIINTKNDNNNSNCTRDDNAMNDENVDDDQNEKELVLKKRKQNQHLIDSRRYKQRFLPIQDIINEGDLIVIQESFGKLNFVYAKNGDIYSNRNGHFHHVDFIGKPYGTKVRSRTQYGFGYCYVLKPTPELWTRSLNHRTQIVHELDQSQIIYQLYIKPGMNIIESGTGSAAMSYSILRAIAPTGHLYTYEFNEHRAITATEEFTRHNLSPKHVTVYHRDVCANGFMDHTPTATTTTTTSNTATSESNNIKDSNNKNKNKKNVIFPKENTIDAIFLDLPEPWVAIPYAARMIRYNSRIASYSPCVEQSQRTVETLEQYGFHTIQTYEYRLREYYVDDIVIDTLPTMKRTKPTPHDIESYQTTNTTTKDTIVKNPKDNNKNKDNKVQPVDHDTINDDDVNEEPCSNMMKNDKQVQQVDDVNEEAQGNKKKNDTQIQLPDDDYCEKKITTKTTTTTTKATENRKRMLVARPFTTMRGHTAFLTFATSPCYGTTSTTT